MHNGHNHGGKPSAGADGETSLLRHNHDPNRGEVAAREDAVAQGDARGDAADSGHAAHGHGQLARITGDIDSIRGHLDGLFAELRRRRRAAMNLRVQVRRHPLSLALGVLALAGAVAGAIALGVYRHRYLARVRVRARRFRRGLVRLSRVIKEQQAEAGAGRRARRVAASALATGGKLAVAFAGRRLRGGHEAAAGA
jgi:hypothetical protein